jgi:biopolymer transport protein ExbD
VPTHLSHHIVNADHAPVEHFSLAAPAGRRRNLVSLTPLIDVVFILLIFFMLASNFFDWQQLPLTTSISEGGQAGATEGLHIRLDAQGQVQLNGEVLSLRRLERQVRTELAANPSLNVQLEPRPGVSLQMLIGLFDRLVQNGARQLNFVVPAINSSDKQRTDQDG